MNEFDFKSWIKNNKTGPYSKPKLIKENFEDGSSNYTDEFRKLGREYLEFKKSFPEKWNMMSPEERKSYNLPLNINKSWEDNTKHDNPENLSMLLYKAFIKRPK